MQTNVLYNEDCVAVMKSIVPSKSVDLIIADPPYNISQSKSFKNGDGTTGFKGWKPVMEEDWDAMTEDEYREFTFNWLSESYRILNDKGSIYICSGTDQLFNIGVTMRKIGFTVLNLIAWHKPNAFPYNYGKTRYCPSTEWVVFARKGKSHKFNYTEFLRDNWVINTIPGKKRLHPTQKPLELFERMIIHSSNEGDLVFDPFSGGGTTLSACKKLNRNFIVCEKTQRFADASRDAYGVDVVNIA